MRLRSMLFLTSLVLVFFGSRTARAYDADGWYFGPRLTANRWRLSGTKIGADTYAIDGSRLGSVYGGSLDVAGGLRYRWFYGELAFAMGTGGGVQPFPVPASDLTLSPEGWLFAVGPRLELGAFAHVTKMITVRGGAALGYQFITLGMQRPGYPDTKAIDAQGTEVTLGPTAAVLFSPSWFSIGAVTSADLLHVGSGSLGVILSHDW